MELKVRGVLLGQSKASDIVVRDGMVVSVRSAGTGKCDAGSKTSMIGPTLFDTQVNGLRGINLQTPSLRTEDVLAITDALAQGGVSHWIPTLITGEIETMIHACRTVAAAMRDKTVARAVPGIHLEGPYISPMDGPRGAHPREHVRPPNLREFDRLYKAADGKIAYVTMAPEVKGAEAFIRALTDRGVQVSLGHHNGTPDDIARAVDAGATMCTHLGNGLASTIHRHNNPLWPQLADDRLKAGLIADLHHLPAPVLKSFVRMKRPENVILVSDCVHIAGLPPGQYQLSDLAVELLPTGRICLSGTDLLAGSSLMLLQGVLNAVHATDLSFEQAFACAGAIPGKLFGLNHHFALPKAGSKADFICFEIRKQKQGPPKATIRAVLIHGERRV